MHHDDLFGEEFRPERYDYVGQHLDLRVGSGFEVQSVLRLLGWASVLVSAHCQGVCFADGCLGSDHHGNLKRLICFGVEWGQMEGTQSTEGRLNLTELGNCGHVLY